MIFIYSFLNFNIAHFFGDYVFVNDSMLKAKKLGNPILVHSAVHSFLMSVSCLFINPKAVFFIFSIQFVSHFLIDLLKGKLNYWFPSLSFPKNKSYWIVFGLDQFLHQLVIALQTLIVLLT